MKPSKITSGAELRAIETTLKGARGYAFVGLYANQIHNGGTQLDAGEFGDDVLCIPVSTHDDVGTLVALTETGARRWAIGYVAGYAREQRACAYLHAWAVVSGGGIDNTSWFVRGPIAKMLEDVAGLDAGHRTSCEDGAPMRHARWSLSSQAARPKTAMECPAFPRALLSQLRELAAMPLRKANGGMDDQKIAARFERAKQLVPDLATIDPTPATFEELSSALGVDVVPYLTPERAAKVAAHRAADEYGVNIVVTAEEMAEAIEGLHPRRAGGAGVADRVKNRPTIY